MFLLFYFFPYKVYLNTILTPAAVPSPNKCLNIRVDGLEKGQHSLEKGQQLLEEGQKEIKAEMADGFDRVHKKLDTIYAQVAHNTEQEVRLNEVAAKEDN